MPVLEGLWGQDRRMRGVGVCADEAPRSPVWGPLRMPPVTCGGGLSLALELPALIRQLRAAWRARRGGPERSEASTWEEAEEVLLERESRSSLLKGNVFNMAGAAILISVCQWVRSACARDALNRASGLTLGGTNMCASPSLNSVSM